MEIFQPHRQWSWGGNVHWIAHGVKQGTGGLGTDIGFVQTGEGVHAPPTTEELDEVTVDRAEL